MAVSAFGSHAVEDALELPEPSDKPIGEMRDVDLPERDVRNRIGDILSNALNPDGSYDISRLNDVIKQLDEDKLKIVHQLERTISHRTKDFMQSLFLTEECLIKHAAMRKEILNLRAKLRQLDKDYLVDSDIYLALLCQRRNRIQVIKDRVEKQFTFITLRQEVTGRADTIMALILAFDHAMLEKLLLPDHHRVRNERSPRSKEVLTSRMSRNIAYTPICISRLVVSLQSQKSTSDIETNLRILQPIYSLLGVTESHHGTTLSPSVSNYKAHLSHIETVEQAVMVATRKFSEIPKTVLKNSLKSKKNPEGELTSYLIVMWNLELTNLLNNWQMNQRTNDPRAECALLFEAVIMWLQRFETIFQLNAPASIPDLTITELSEKRAEIWTSVDKKIAPSLTALFHKTGGVTQFRTNDIAAYEFFYLVIRFTKLGEVFVQGKVATVRREDVTAKTVMPIVESQTKHSPAIVEFMKQATSTLHRSLLQRALNLVIVTLTNESWKRTPVHRGYSFFHRCPVILPMSDPRYSGGLTDAYDANESNPFVGYNHRDGEQNKKKRWPVNIIEGHIKRNQLGQDMDDDLAKLEHRLALIDDDSRLKLAAAKSPVVTKSSIIIAERINHLMMLIQVNPDLADEVMESIARIIELNCYYVAMTLLTPFWHQRLSLTRPNGNCAKDLNRKSLYRTFASLQDQDRYPHVTSLLRDFDRMRTTKKNDKLSSLEKLIRDIIDQPEVFLTNPILNNALSRYGATARLGSIGAIRSIISSAMDTIYLQSGVIAFLDPKKSKRVASMWNRCKNIAIDLNDLMQKDIARGELAKHGEWLLHSFRSINWMSRDLKLEALVKLCDTGHRLTRHEIGLLAEEEREGYDALVTGQMVEAMTETERFFDDFYIGLSCLGNGSIPLEEQLKLWNVVQYEFYKMWLYFMAKMSGIAYNRISESVDKKKQTEKVMITKIKEEIPLVFQRLLLTCKYVTKLILSYHQKIIDKANELEITLENTDIGSAGSTSLDALIAYSESHSLPTSEIIAVGKYWVGKGAFDLTLMSDIIARNSNRQEFNKVMDQLDDWALEWLTNGHR